MGSFPRRVFPSLQTCRVVVLGVASLTSCAHPPPKPLVTEEILASVEARTRPTSGLLEAAFDLHGVPPLGLRRPDPAAPPADARTDVFWHTHAVAFEPSVRAARRRLRVRTEEAGAAGQPARPRLAAGTEELGAPERDAEISATFDLLGLLGLGPSAADKAVAQELIGLAFDRLEEAAFRAVFLVDRARVRVWASRERERVLLDLLSEARPGRTRLELLDRQGRMAAGLLGRVHAVIAALELQHTQRQVETTRAREALAIASGLPPDAPPIHEALFPSGPPQASTAEAPPRGDLLNTVPKLRSTRRAYALEEARLRAAVAAWWPHIGVGAPLRFRMDDFLVGGALSLELPWPKTVNAGIQAALESREGARETIEDTLQTTLAEAHARHRERDLARRALEGDVGRLLLGSAAAWRGARARLSVIEGRDPVELWLDAFQLRTAGVLADIDGRERWLLADLAFREAAGLTRGLVGDAP